MTALLAKALRLNTADANFEAAFQQRLHWSADADAAIESRVADILADVQKRGDAAVLEYTQRFDGLAATRVADLEIGQAELQAALDSLPGVQRDALQAAAARVRKYHEAQKKASGESWSYRDEDGTLLGQKVTPLDRVGIYVPGGKAAYPSSVLMNAIPAHVAGVPEIVMVVPTPAELARPLETGRAAEAQRTILAAVEQQVGGSGAAAANTLAGAQRGEQLFLRDDAMTAAGEQAFEFGAQAVVGDGLRHQQVGADLEAGAGSLPAIGGADDLMQMVRKVKKQLLESLLHGLIVLVKEVIG